MLHALGASVACAATVPVPAQRFQSVHEARPMQQHDELKQDQGAAWLPTHAILL